MTAYKYYLNIGKASDLESPKERAIYRAFEILPGGLIWITLIGIVFLSWFKPAVVGYFIIAFVVYFLLRIAHFSIHLTASYKQLKKNLGIDWLEKLKTEKFKTGWENIYHLIILPIYKESPEIARETFRALSASQYPKEKMIVVLATEERAGEQAKKVAEEIEKEFGDLPPTKSLQQTDSKLMLRDQGVGSHKDLVGGKFYQFLATFHPKDIKGEIAGKGSNITWAGRQAKEKIIDPAGIPYEHIIVSTFDIDTQVYPQYFSCLTYHYLTSPSPTRSSFQPIPLYLNNVWEAPFFSRVVSASNVFWQAMQQQRPEKIVTYSSHSMSFKAAVETGFWQTNIVSEDAGIFWKSLLFYDGDYRIIPLYYPVSMDCVVARNFKQTVINQYKQQRRWAWGSEGIPYLLFGFYKDEQRYRLGKKAARVQPSPEARLPLRKTLGCLSMENRKIPFKKKFRYGFLLIEGFWAWGTNAFLILSLGWLPLILGGEKFNTTILAYNLPNLTGKLMTFGLLGLAVCVIISLRLLSPRPSHCSRWKSLGMILQWVFFPLTFIFFGSIPAIDAQTRLMLGKRIGFWVTEKTRKNNPVNSTGKPSRWSTAGMASRWDKDY